jgi:hypothetical protein
MGISDKFRMSQQASVHQISESFTSEEEFNFTNYPNPVDGKFTVTVKLPATQEIEISVYDSNGNLQQVLYKGQVSEKNVVEFESDLRHLRADIYYLKLITADKTLVRKIIVK